MTCLVCGEALFDCFIDGQDGPGAMRLDARAGGSPFNVAIGIARLGGRAALLTGLSDDLLGERLFEVLASESVDTGYLVRSGRRTTLSLVGVDGMGHPSYVFYGLGSADCSVTIDALPVVDAAITALHFGSYSLVVPPVANAFAHLAASAGERFVSLDPNVRTSVEPELDLWRERVVEYARMADLLKVSSEDLETLFPGAAAETKAAEWLGCGVALVVVTDGAGEIRAWTRRGHHVRRTPPSMDVLDTVGAGDSFQAALLARLTESGTPKQAVDVRDAAELCNLLDFAARAAAITCSRRGADLPRRGEVFAKRSASR